MSTSPARSAAGTGARTRSVPRSASPSTSRRSTTTRSRCVTATRWNRCVSRSTDSSTWCATRECSSNVSDYYDLLGVDADADKDTIKAAYRDQLDGASQADRAKLNKAWNVLSDPVQRERYDDARSEGWLDDTEAEDAGTTTPARRGGRDATPASSRQRPARPAPEPTVVLPEGMELAEPRSRGTALLIDFGVLFVIYILALSVVLPALLKDQYPVQTDRIDAINKDIKRLDRDKGNADDDAGDKK